MHAMPKPLFLLPAALAVAALSLTACGGVDDSTVVDPGSAPSVTCSYPSDGAPAAKEVDPPSEKALKSGDVDITIKTTVGDLGATLGRDAAPCTVNSFL